MKQKLTLLGLGFLLLFSNELLAQSQTFSTQVVASSDDAEEQGLNGSSPGTMDLTSSDLELVQDGNDGDQFVGIRFVNVAIPQNSLITNAYIQFTVDEDDDTPGTKYIQVEDSDNPPTFAGTSGNISGRALLQDSIEWANIPVWANVGSAGEDQQTPDLSILVQQIVNRQNWTSGNAISFVITGNGERVAESFDGGVGNNQQAILVVEYVPLVTEVFELGASSDDSESNLLTNGLGLTSSDLEFTSDGANVQAIATRFPNVTIPAASQINNAYIQFTVDETDAGGQVDALMAFEESTNSAPITLATDPAARDYGTQIIWGNIPDWTIVDEAGPDQRTPDLTALVQEVIDQDGWLPGNAMLAVFVDPAVVSVPGYTGNTSKRVARSYDNDPAKGAKLVVSYYPPAAFQNGNFPVAKEASWKFDDSGTDLTAENWTDLNYNDTLWTFGDAILGYGNNNETTTLDFGPDANNKYPTYYLRHTFQVDNAAQYDSLVFNVLRDDGVVVYVNGTEAFRMNMPTGPVDYNTLASSPVGGADETTFFETRTENLLVDGLNVIAVELHQSSVSSSDLSFDMEVGFTLPPLDPASFPLTVGSDWHYLDDGSDLDNVDWQSDAFANQDDFWAQGPGILGYGDPVATEISFGPDPNNKYVTYYFRREIDIDLNTLPDSLELGLLRDDGAIVYLNGQEIRRDNLPEGDIDYLTTAVNTVAGGDEDAYWTSKLFKSDFEQGINTIAVQVHNRDVFSSDLAFDLYLREAPIANPPALGCENGNEAHIACFTSIQPTAQTPNLITPTSSHRFQALHKQGDTYTIGGGTVPGNHDFTAFVSINGSSEEGYLSVNHENTPGGVSMIGLHYEHTSFLWVVDSTQAVDFYNDDLVTTTRNCSGGITPWGTVLTAEETLNSGDVNNDGYQDVGWMVEIDPATARVKEYGNGIQEKLWAVGRVSHENAVVLEDEVTLFTGEDGGSSAVFKFIADNPQDLTSGSLYALQLDLPLSGGEPTGNTGTWIQIPNATQTDRNDTRALAIALGATNFNGVEDIEVHPITGEIYFTSKGNGRIYKFTNNLNTVSNFETFVGGTSYVLTTESGIFTEPWGGGNDNLTFDDQGNLWVLQDGGRNYVWLVRPDHVQEAPKVELFASFPNGSEPCGLTFSPDYRFGFISIQHPSGANTAQTDATGNDVAFNASTTIVFSRSEWLGAQAPLADFTSDITTVELGGSVIFTDISTNSPTELQWVFDGGVPAVSSNPVETVTYNGLGLYNVQLTATNEIGEDEIVKSDYIRVINPAPVTDFVANNIQVPVGAEVTFFDLSSNTPTNWDWTFEGGTPATSIDEMPTVTYSAIGTYDVRLSTSNDAGDGTTEEKLDYIEVTLVTSLEEPTIEESLVVFPNPTNGKVNLKMDLQGGEDLIIDLYDLSGRKLADLHSATAVSGTSIFTYDVSKYTDSSQILAFRIMVDGKVSQRIIKFDR